jgi:hypothetical protein
MNRFHACVVGLVLLTSLSGCASGRWGHDDDEVPVALSETPAPVQATLERERAGGKVTEVEKEVKDGKTIYSADLEINGEEWDISVAEDGTVISKEREKAGEK